MTFIEDGVIVEGRAMNAAEKAERKQWAKDAATAEQAALNAVAVQESARNKLAQLGLTPDEVSSLIGGLQ